MLKRIASAGVLLALACAPSAHAGKPVKKSPRLWATVNVCDTERHPDEIGIRASMPGLKRLSILSMRFRVQYFASADSKWHNFASNPQTDSGWVRLGRQRRGAAESGWNVRFRPPEAGGSHQLRGAVYFRWTRRGRAVKRTREITEAGHRSTAGADPPRYSAATCLIQ